VLNNKRRGRLGSSTPRTSLGDELSTGLPTRGDAVPSVLGRATRTRTRPPLPGQPGIGADPAIEGATSPVLRAPAAPPTGSAVSGLEEVPSALRAAPPVQRGTGHAPQAAPRELTHRGTRRTMNVSRPDDLPEPTSLVTDEEAFSVETPGGGVLTGRQEGGGYAPEPQAQVRGQ
jgi:hypothetical protein